ncbi:MAG: hypothetical protein C3F12_05260 [Candidatus Methylomirabilota bacterium]|nr:type II toxin-antitoxin system VapC family toxin [Candidatus Methylomirabilis sp.]NJD69826.1 type II toxin-antitoxin system VapC family toxin [candidate division NC10 bacterium]PWB47378.1 MAG: hypothetical protein C3F12_05260 [candidate division NC10 bacterium]
MPSLFVDTSALVKFYYPEPDSDRIEALLLRAERIYITNLTVVEMASALSKKVRMGDIQKEQETVVWNTFLDDLQTWQVELVTLNDRDYLKAADLIRELGRRYGLKTLDALQLSAAHSFHDAKFLCSDKTLTKTALKIGIKII